MPYHARFYGFITVFLLGTIGCGQDGRAPAEPSFQTNEWCDTHPIECNGGVPDPEPSAPGYYLGASITAATCFSPTGAGITDLDKDGMSDTCEQSLAQAFRPSLSLAPSSWDCDPTKEPYWAAKYFPAQGSVVRIAYLFGYHQDCGDTNLLGSVLSKFWTVIHLAINNLTLNFDIVLSTDDPGDAHAGDSEFVMVDVGFSSATKHWYVTQVEFSAHHGTAADGSRTVSAPYIQFPDKYGGYPRVWVARNKHANYHTQEVCKVARLPLGQAKDNCDINQADRERFQVIGLRNLGSAHVNFISDDSCVQSTQPLFYPGTECFWRPGEAFDGWARHPSGHPPTPYFSILILEYECYRYTGTSAAQCLDFGVIRK